MKHNALQILNIGLRLEWNVSWLFKTMPDED